MTSSSPLSPPVPNHASLPNRHRGPLFIAPSPISHRTFAHRPFAFPFFAPHATPRTRRPPLTLIPCASLRPTDPASQYVPLHVHSDFSLLDGASQLPSLVARAEALGVPALALTDHGVLYGAVQLVHQCANTGVKPIIGNEMYLVNANLPVDPDAEVQRLKRYHLIVLAKNTTGYRNLVKLTSMAHLTGKVGKGIFARPSINKAQLYAHREGLLVSSACLGGEIPQAILNDDIDSARAVATWYRDVFGDDFYLEIQDHGSDEDRKVNPVMLQLSSELGIKLIATNDSHFTNCLDAEAHDAMICIQTGKLLTDEKRMHYAGNEYFKSIEEMRQCFVDHLPIEAVDDALYNTMEVAAKVETYDLFGATRIPDFPVPPHISKSHDEYLRMVAREGLHTRLETRSRSGLVDAKNANAYTTRLEEEVDMICRMGFSSYFLVVWDYIKHARELNIPVGPGRGSAAGSLAAFALRITDVDPINFNLLFERFLNPERKSMPDIDTDFSVEGRERVIAYVTERYGRDRVAQIITFNRMTSKAVLKDVARVHNVPYSEADRLAKLIPVVRGKPTNLSQMMAKETPSKEFKSLIERNPGYGTWLDKAQRIEGANKTYGVHAAGVVISASPLTDIVPLSKAKHGETITQYAMEDVEALGLLKMDFLGLKNLTVIETALRFINEGRRRLGIMEDLDFSVDELPLDDANTYKLLAEGELDGIFQLDASGGMRSIVREIRPSSLEDISSILALYRPGPLDAGLIPKFIRRKHGIDPIEYEHPLLEPILKDTYGIMVYQEQIMRIARDLAGYSLGQADILRRAMGKKKMKEMELEKPKFVDGAKRNEISEEIATNLFDQMLKFADYCFNKSHSTAYAYLTYQTAYLKANYPVEYSAALLRSNMNQSDKLVRYLADANVSGVHVKPPSVNRSSLGFTVDRSEADGPVVLFGLEAVKTVGGSVSTALIEERERNGPFVNIIDLIERVDLRVLNKRAMGSLILAGTFDELHPNRKVLQERLDGLLIFRRKLRDKRKRREAKNLSDEDIEVLNEEERLAWEEAAIALSTDSIEKPDFTSIERLAGEKATLGFYASGHPLYDVQDISKILGCTPVAVIVGETGDSDIRDSADEESSEAVNGHVKDGTDVLLLSCVTDLKRMTTAKGKKMAKWTIEDVTGRMTAIVFPGSYELMDQVVLSEQKVDPLKEDSSVEEKEIRYVVEEDTRVLVWGRVDRGSSGSLQIIVDDVQRVEDAHVVVAKARYDPKRPPSLNVHFLQSFAGSALEISVNDDMGGTYVDANGEVRRRRRKRAAPLAEKKRVPLVMHNLLEDGSSIYVNAGNEVRFPLDCEGVMETVHQKTGFELQLLSVGRDLMIADKALSAVVAKVSCDEDILPATTEPVHVKAIEDEKMRTLSVSDGAVSDIEDVSVYEDTVNDVTTGEVDEVALNKRLDDVVSAAEQAAEKSRAGGDVENRRRAANNKIDRDVDTEEMIFVGGIQMSKSEYDEVASTMKVNRRSREVEVPKEMSDAERALSYIRSMKVERDTFHFRDFSRSGVMQDFVAHDVFQSSAEKASERLPAYVTGASANVTVNGVESSIGTGPVQASPSKQLSKEGLNGYGSQAAIENAPFLEALLTSPSDDTPKVEQNGYAIDEYGLHDVDFDPHVILDAVRESNSSPQADMIDVEAYESHLTSERTSTTSSESGLDLSTVSHQGTTGRLPIKHEKERESTVVLRGASLRSIGTMATSPTEDSEESLMGEIRPRSPPSSIFLTSIPRDETVWESNQRSSKPSPKKRERQLANTKSPTMTEKDVDESANSIYVAAADASTESPTFSESEFVFRPADSLSSFDYVSSKHVSLRFLEDNGFYQSEESQSDGLNQEETSSLLDQRNNLITSLSPVGNGAQKSLQRASISTSNAESSQLLRSLSLAPSQQTILTGNDETQTCTSLSSDTASESKVVRTGTVINVSDGYVVEFDTMKLAGVLDSVCMMASDVAAKRSHRRHVITCMSGLKLDNLVERGVSLSISGRVAYASDKDVYALVDVRETEASGKRKRVRSFGPVGVVLHTEEAVAAVSLKTKKAKKSVESFLQKVANCHNTSGLSEPLSGTSLSEPKVGKEASSRQAGLTTVYASEVGVSMLRDVSAEGETSDATHLLDGGEIVSYMARAAEVCAKNALNDLGEVAVVAMEWLTSTSSTVWTGVRKIYVRTHLEGLSFGTLKIQVEAEVVTSEGGQVCKLRATFGVCCRDGRLLRRVRVQDDDVALFDKSEALAQLSNVEHRLREIV